MPFEKIELPSPRDSLIAEIERRIIKGKLAVGEKLPTERELEAQTGISKSVIHFALKDLERLGFVKIIPRQGIYVADFAKEGSFETLNELLKFNGGKLTYKMSFEIVELRNAIEGGAMIRLAANHTKEDMAKLRETIDELEAVRDKNISIHELSLITRKFHYLICELSGNDIFALVMNAFAPISDVLWENCAAFWGIDGFLEQDKKLIELIEQGDGHEAQKYIEDAFAVFLKEFHSGNFSPNSK